MEHRAELAVMTCEPLRLLHSSIVSGDGKSKSSQLVLKVRF